MKIRPANIHDKERVAELGYEMHQESNFNSLDYDHQKIQNIVDYSLHEDPFYYMAVAETDDGLVVGMMGGLCVPTFFGDDQITSDLALYITPEHRGLKVAAQLLDSFVTWSKERGAKHCNVGSSAGIVDERYMSFLAKFGFKKIGFLARKTL